MSETMKFLPKHIIWNGVKWSKTIYKGISSSEQCLTFRTHCRREKVNDFTQRYPIVKRRSIWKMSENFQRLVCRGLWERKRTSVVELNVICIKRHMKFSYRWYGNKYIGYSRSAISCSGRTSMSSSDSDTCNIVNEYTPLIV